MEPASTLRPRHGPRPLPGGEGRPAAALLALAALLAAAPAAILGQEPGAGARVLEGELRVDGVPADTGTVTLHRVGPGDPGPVDSAAVEAAGRFTLEIPGSPPGGEEAVHFASARYEGVLYHGPPITGAGEETVEGYVVDAHSTAEAAPGGEALRVARRRVVLEPAADGWAVTDLFAVENAERRALVPAGDDAAAWSHPLPAGATGFRAEGGDVPAERVREGDGHVRVSAPMTPGRRLVVVGYELPPGDGRIPLGAPTDSLEVLVPEAGPGVEVERLERGAPVRLEPETTFRRFTGSELAVGALAFRADGGAGPRLTPPRLAVLLGLLLAALGAWALSGRRTRSS